MSAPIALANGQDPRAISPALILGAAVAALALPSAVLAFSARLAISADAPPDQSTTRFAASDLDPRLARQMAGHTGRGPLFRFTPAGLVMHPDRAVTVAVRVDSQTVREISVRGFIDRTATAGPPMANGIALRIAPTAYNLGVARGYQGFARGEAPLPVALAGELRHVDMPDLSTWRPAGESAGTGTPPRLAPRIQLDERERAGRAPRTLESIGTQTVDLGGSYRLTRNVDVTAGVRYSRDRDRLEPITDGKTDSQAVFVGTQFRF